ncbi:tetratricopeptide repeat-containing sensor histidine kinase [Hymenobacter negativus]|uniref:histidine kinase n=1 Tax=Hymenobacter negativus TaxID=2795026 RepID=A0ABS0QB17_9BACT|nr:tetratricopeptide repeat protein [Hymenobacter negativus]MBH8559815.1 tetratricopeptide repeat-containing sensor histidine kinase [Hymenobacter negativus]
MYRRVGGAVVLLALLAAGLPPADTAQVRALRHQAQLLLREGHFDQAQPLLLQSKELAHRLNFREGEALALRMLGKAELVHGNLVRARTYLTEGVALARRTPGQPDLPNLLLALGQAANEQDDYPGALRACEEALRLYHARGDVRSEAQTRNGLGIIYSSRSDFPRALAALLPALRQARVLRDTLLQVNCLNNIANVYLRRFEYQRGVDYLEQALPLVRQSANPGALADCLTNLASGYMALHSPKAEGLFREAIRVSEGFGEKAQLGVVLSSFGDWLDQQHRLPEAQQVRERALKLLQAAGDQDNSVYVLNELADMADRLHQPALAEARARQALAIAQRIGSANAKYEATKTLAHVLKQRGDYRQALAYAEQAQAAHDTLFSQAKAEEIGRLQGDFQLGQERDHAQMLARTAEAQQLRLRQQQRELWGLGLGLVAAAVGGLVLWRLNRLLGRKNQQIEQQRAELTALNATKDQLFSIIGHDLRGPLHSLHAFVGLLSGPPLPPEKLAQYTQRLTRTLDHTLALLENLLHWAALQMRATGPPQPENMALAAVVEENFDLLSPAAEAGQVALHHDLTGEEHVWADPSAVRLMLRNLLSNAIKFTPLGGTVRVSARREAGTWQLAVADTGLGLPVPTPRQQVPAETPERRAAGAGQPRSSGLGLKLSRDVALRNGAQLWMASAGPGQGSTFTLGLPLAEVPAVAEIAVRN